MKTLFLRKGLLGTIVLAAFLTGCTEQKESPKETVTQPHTQETTAETTMPETTAAPIQETTPPNVLQENILGEWRYEGHACIMYFEENGVCKIQRERIDYICNYQCRENQVIITYEGNEVAKGTLAQNGNLYFNDEKMGFYAWEEISDSVKKDPDAYMGTWECDWTYCVFTVQKDLTFVLEDKFGTMHGGVLWNEEGYMELCAEEGPILKMTLTGENGAKLGEYEGDFYKVDTKVQADS